MKKLLAIMFVGLFLISFASAFEFDNKKTYNEESKTITFKNSLLGIPTTTIAQASLISNTCSGAQSCSSIINLNLLKDYDNPVRDFNYILLIEDHWQEIGGQSVIISQQTGTKDVSKPTYELICSKTETDKWGNDLCSWVQNGNITIQEPIWEEITESLLLQGNYTLKIDMQKGIFNTVDWYATWFGIESKEWAVFDNAIGGYWTFDTNSPSSTTFNQDNTTINNFTDYTGSPIRVMGKVGPFQMDFDRGDGDSLGNTTFDFSSITEFSYSFWMNTTSITTEQAIIGANWDAGGGFDNFEVEIAPSGDLIQLTVGDGSSYFLVKNASNFAVNQSHFVVFTAKEGGQLEIYIDNENLANTTFGGTFGLKTDATTTVGWRNIAGDIFYDGTLDEVGFWAVQLTADDVDELWNNGDGLLFGSIPALGALVIDLTAPTTGVSTINNTLLFEGNFSVLEGNFTNSTLIVWNPDGSEFQRNFSVIDGLNNFSNIDVTGLTFGTYEWNYFVCAVNSTSTLCNTTDTNSTFNIVGFEINSQTFNGSTNETSRQNFQLNISTITSILSVNANLKYNGTSFVGDVSCDSASSTCIVSRDIDIPLVINTDESENKTLFWEITTFDGSSSTTVNTSTVGQNVTRIHLEQCSATFTDQTLNFTSADERNFTRINPFSFQATFDAWLGGGDVKRTTSFSNSSLAEMSLCSLPNTNTFVDAIIEYNDVSNVTYTTRNYYFQNNTISSVPQNITLFLLESGESTTFILKVQDQNLLPVPDVLITIQRFDPGDNTFNTVQIARTDDNGATVGFFETEVVDYRFIISRNGEILLTTTAQKIVGESVPFTLIFTIGVVTTAPWDNFGNITNLTSTLVFNSSSEIVTYTYQDLSDLFEEGRLLVELNNPSNTSNQVICNVTSVQSSAQLTCDISAGLNASYIAQGFITRSGNEAVVNLITFSINTFAAIAGNLGLLMGFFMILVASFTFKFNEIAGVWMVTITMFFVNLMGLINFGLLAITAMFALAIIISVQFGK